MQLGSPLPCRRRHWKRHRQTGSLSELQILLAEDNLVNQKLALGILEKLGHRVTVVNNGMEALEQLERRDFDLVLMDVQMPELDGLAATRELRRREAPAKTHVPVVAMTAHAMKGDRERCLASGMDDYLGKPIRLKDMSKNWPNCFQVQKVNPRRTISNGKLRLPKIWFAGPRRWQASTVITNCCAS